MSSGRGAEPVTHALVRVLVVDDSAYVRKVVRQVLSRSPFIDVIGTARDGAEALEMAEELRPDVVTCDISMPVMDGVAFVRAQMARRPVPIVIISVASGNGEQVLSALAAGAIDFVQKPTALADERLLDIGDDLVAKVTAASLAAVTALPVVVAAPNGAPKRPQAPRATGRVQMVVLGVSTGGPQGLKVVIPALPPDFPVPIAIVLHMPVGYTELYAQKLDEMSALHVVEAREGDEVVAGCVFIAPAGRHLTFHRAADGRVRTHLDVQPMGSLHRPSVDELFKSAAEVFRGRVLGVVMTGMGSDGREGAGWIKAQGGVVLTEAEESCVVFGMPRAVVEAGLSDASVSLSGLAPAILERL
jgi:two-component system, chemotaxis family, protein-glutamate methylesterase/glutaminase